MTYISGMPSRLDVNTMRPETVDAASGAMASGGAGTDVSTAEAIGDRDCAGDGVRVGVAVGAAVGGRGFGVLVGVGV
jgi:hypothetical protein